MENSFADDAIIRARAVGGVLVLALSLGAPTSMATTISFDDVAAGASPPGWTAGVTGRGSPRWTIERDAQAPSPPNVLKQSGRGDFPWCVRRDVSVADGYVEVRFKPISGAEDQAGGVVWRWIHARRSAHHDQIRRCAGRTQPVAHAARRVCRTQDQRRARRQTLHRSRRRPHRWGRCSWRLDQSGQRHRLR